LGASCTLEQATPQAPSGLRPVACRHGQPPRLWPDSPAALCNDCTTHRPAPAARWRRPNELRWHPGQGRRLGPVGSRDRPATGKLPGGQAMQPPGLRNLISGMDKPATAASEPALLAAPLQQAGVVVPQTGGSRKEVEQHGRSWAKSSGNRLRWKFGAAHPLPGGARGGRQAGRLRAELLGSHSHEPRMVSAGLAQRVVFVVCAFGLGLSYGVKVAACSQVPSPPSSTGVRRRTVSGRGCPAAPDSKARSVSAGGDPVHPPTRHGPANCSVRGGPPKRGRAGAMVTAMSKCDVCFC